MPTLILLLGIFAIGYGVAWGLYETREDCIVGGLLFGVQGVIAIGALGVFGLLPANVGLNDSFGDPLGLKGLLGTILRTAYLIFVGAFGIAQVFLRSLPARLFGGLTFGVVAVTFCGLLYFAITIISLKR
jgi:hypothetical protein